MDVVENILGKEPYKHISLKDGSTLTFDTKEDYEHWIKLGRP